MIAVNPLSFCILGLTPFFIKYRTDSKLSISTATARKNSGFVEGLNNKIKVVKRHCYGFIKTESLFQRLFLDLHGYEYYA